MDTWGSRRLSSQHNFCNARDDVRKATKSSCRELRFHVAHKPREERGAPHARVQAGDRRSPRAYRAVVAERRYGPESRRSSPSRSIEAPPRRPASRSGVLVGIPPSGCVAEPTHHGRRSPLAPHIKLASPRSLMPATGIPVRDRDHLEKDPEDIHQRMKGTLSHRGLHQRPTPP